jgi:class 3 adenylate cyclase
MLATWFADLARDAVEARGGRVIELRGDEALAVFDGPSQAVRAAVEFQAKCAEESEADPAFPLHIGIDAREAPMSKMGTGAWRCRTWMGAPG